MVSIEAMMSLRWSPGIERPTLHCRKTGGEGEPPTVFEAQGSPPMSVIAIGVALTALVRRRKGLFARFMEARQRQALQELTRHGLRLPRELEEAGLRISARNEDSLPFVR